MTGSARLSQEISERDARLQQREDLQRRERELHRGIEQEQVQIAALQDQIAARQAELKRIADRHDRLAADAQDARRTMGIQRWVDPEEDEDQEPP